MAARSPAAGKTARKPARKRPEPTKPARRTPAPAKVRGHTPKHVAAHPAAAVPDRAALRRHARTIDRRLGSAYPDARCSLDHTTPFELLVATILSAQCTDERVNMVTPALFRRFPTPEHFAGATPEAIEEHIRSTGFFRNKARSIKGAATLIAERFGGAVPATMEELLSLPGVARKTANVVLGTAYGQATGVVVDTHVQRVTRRLGITREKDPGKIERDLMGLLPESSWIAFSHRVIHHGRRTCTARKPRCGACPLSDVCPSVEL